MIDDRGVVIIKYGMRYFAFVAMRNLEKVRKGMKIVDLGPWYLIKVPCPK